MRRMMRYVAPPAPLLFLALLALAITALVSGGDGLATGGSASSVGAPLITISTAPAPVTGATPSTMPFVENLNGEPMLQYLDPQWVVREADALVEGRVEEVLPFRENPLAGQGDPDGPNEHQPILYKGYVRERRQGLRSRPHSPLDCRIFVGDRGVPEQ